MGHERARNAILKFRGTHTLTLADLTLEYTDILINFTPLPTGCIIATVYNYAIYIVQLYLHLGDVSLVYIRQFVSSSVWCNFILAFILWNITGGDSTAYSTGLSGVSTFRSTWYSEQRCICIQVSQSHAGCVRVIHGKEQHDLFFMCHVNPLVCEYEAIAGFLGSDCTV